MVYCNRLVFRRRGLGGVLVGTRLPDGACCPSPHVYVYTWYIYCRVTGCALAIVVLVIKKKKCFFCF